ncbi:Arc family DNA-binding protein [Azotobacter chroococcum]|uniref:Arc family DNA-binding protein n=1 Tax=Azotobacter chroococcum TaxID=353 RepID=UPI0010ADB838|nr:Arc family DNA-binding protein [Azotobacter chroococcum]TKD30022.1 Arc family DNA-binding protein [Azotobacter chroococcum]
MTDSRQADKFVIRLPDGMRDQIRDAAIEQHTSMNTVFIQALESYLDGQRRQKILLDALSEKLGQLEEA